MTILPAEVESFLGDLAAAVPESLAIVEVGAYKGQSTCRMARSAAEGLGARVWTVDPWELAGNSDASWSGRVARAAFCARVAAWGLAERVTVIQGFSVDEASRWAGPEIGLLYIDGDHHEESVRADFNAWRPHLAEHATVVFDDYASPEWPGVRVAVDGLGLDARPAAGRLAVCRIAPS